MASPEQGTSTDRSPRSRKRRWLFRLLAATLVPLLALTAVEAALRLCGFGHPTAFFIPAGEDARGASLLRENPKFGWRFFPPALARAPPPALLVREKPPGVTRIFVFGESAAKGEPEPAHGFARILEVLLEARFPERQFEVVNAAMTAINSHAILPIARDCAALQGDIWLLYMGNNEVVGPFGPGTVFGRQSPSLFLIRAGLALRSTRICQLLQAALAPRAAGGGTPETWGGMEMFLAHQVRRDDPRLESVHAGFEANLEAILDVARGSGAKVVLGTLVSNIKDCAPFASLHSVALAPKRLREWEEHYRAGAEREAAGDLAGAAAAYREALEIDAEYAEIHFRLARCLAAAGDHDAAAGHYREALELDTVRFRPDRRLNDVIRRCAAARGGQDVRLVDAESAFAAESPHGLTGEEFLYEHVHFNFEGNYLLARLFAQAVAEVLGAGGADGGGAKEAPAWLERDACARRLAYTPWARRSVIETVRRRLDKPPYNRQLNHAARDERLRGELDRLAPAGSAAAFEEQAALYREALSRDPGDWVLRDQLAGFLAAAYHDAEAAAEWRRVVEVVPHHFLAHYKLGMVLRDGNRTAEAEAELREAVRLRPDFGLAHVSLGELLAAAGRHEDAAGEFARAAELDPQDGGARLARVQSLEALGRLEEAKAILAAMIAEQQPRSAAAHRRLGALLAREGKRREALEHLEKAAALEPGNAKAHLELGTALAAEGRFSEALARFARAVGLDAKDTDARYSLGVELARKGSLEEAEVQFAEAVRLRPDFTQAHFCLGVVAFKQGKLDAAIASLSEARRLDPKYAPAAQQLEEAEALRRSRDGLPAGR